MVEERNKTEAVDENIVNEAEEVMEEPQEGQPEKLPDEAAAEEQPEEMASESEETEEDKEPTQGEKIKKFFAKKKDAKDEKIEELTDRLRRQMAEFDNYRKRTEKEKAGMYMVGAKEVVEKAESAKARRHWS